MTGHPLHDAGPRSRSFGPLEGRLAVPLLWAALVLVAAVLRLVNLGAAPLSPAEAGEALAAFSAGRGQGAQLAASLFTSGYSPLLLHVNTFLFALFQGGEGLARVVPALAGVGLVLTPLLLRQYLGRWGTLGTGLLLALSPTALFFSRTLDGTVPAALGVMLLVGCAARFLDTWRPGLVTVGAVGLAAATTAGSGAWGLLMGLLVALAAALWAWRDQVEWVWPIIRPALMRGLVAAVLGLLALGSGLGLHPGGLSATGEQFLAWLARFRPLAGALTPSPPILLLAYEPLILVAGLAGLVLAARRRHGMGLLWALWAAVSGLQLTLMPGRQPADLLWVLLPLAGLGGLAVEELVRSLEARGRWLNEGLYLPISLVLWAHFGLTLARYASAGAWADLVLGGMAVLLQVLLTAAFGFAVSAPEPQEELAEAARRGVASALRAGGLSLGLVLLVVTFSIGWGLGHLRPADARELLVQDPTAVEVRKLVEVVERVSWRGIGAEKVLPITVLGDARPALAWALRRFDLRVADRLGPDEEPALVIAGTEQQVPYGYVGEVFPLRRAWTPGGLSCSGWPPDCRTLAQWWLYRSSSEPPFAVEWIALWVREDLGAEDRSR